jgi:opacity protein-like surface antigen
MFEKLTGVLFFVLIVFINSNLAQTLEKLSSLEKPEAIFSWKGGKEKNPFAAKFFEKVPDGKAANDKEQTEPTDYRFRRGEKELNVDFGFSPFEPTTLGGEKQYNTAGRKLGVAAVRWGRVFGTVKNVSYQYLFEVVPLVVSMKNEVVNYEYISPAETPNATPTKRETASGFGITPLAFRFYFLAKNRLKPFIQLGAGIVYFNKPMPLPKTSRFNFTGYFGGGVMYQITRKQAISLSYRYYHISNGNTQHINPGYNANVFALGYSFFYK